MASKRDHPHIKVPAGSWRTRQPYTGSGRGSRQDLEPTGGRPSHGKFLEDAIKAAEKDAMERRKGVAVEINGATPGIYLEFESFPGLELALKSMEHRRAKDPRRHIELVAVKERAAGEGGPVVRTQRAAVFVPDGELPHFFQQLKRYVDPTKKKKPREIRHEDVYDRVANVRLAALRALWTDADNEFPKGEDETIWWEVWLRRTDGQEVERLYEYCAQAGVTLADRRIAFADRIVTLVFTSPKTLAASLDVMGDIAELQRAKETAAFFVEEKPAHQAEWAQDLAERTTAAPPEAPAVCLFDTGVNAGHPLLSESLAQQDQHACDPSWGVDDMKGHGTEMAGLALYGDLVEHLAGDAPVELRHCLESVKILPPQGENDPDLYGAITAEATSRPEIQAPRRRRIFSMAVTAVDGRDRGQPTSWSASVDALASGRSFDPSDQGLKYIDEH